MKKIFLSVIATLVAVSGILVSCTADDEFELEQNAREAKAQEMKTQILALAEEYDLDVEVGDLTNWQSVNEKEALKRIDSIFLNANKIKGRYNISSEKNGNNVILTQDIKKGLRKRKLTSEIENYEYSFEDYHMGSSTCSCTIYYSLNLSTNEMSVTDVVANVSDYQTLMGSCSDNVSGFVDHYGVIRISGYVDVIYSSPTMTITYHVDGFYDGSKGEITWR